MIYFKLFNKIKISWFLSAIFLELISFNYLELISFSNFFGIDFFAYLTSNIYSLLHFLHILPRVFAHYDDIFAYFTSKICSLHPRVIFIKGNDDFNVTFWKKTAFQWLFYSRPSNFTFFLVEGTRTFLERPFSHFWVTFLLTYFELYLFSPSR